MLRAVLVAAISSVVASQSPLHAKPVVLTGEVTAVTVYQGQALVTREVTLDSADGLTEVVVTDLPARVTAGSLYAEPVGDLEIRSVRYRVRPVAEDTRTEVRELDEQIQGVQDELARVKAHGGLLESRAQYLEKLENFTTQTASHELTSGVLDATTLKELTKTIFEGREQVALGRLEAGRENRELNKQLKLLNGKRQRLTSSSSRAIREAVVFVDAPQAGPARLRLTYLVSGASWSPSYNLRAGEDRDRVVVEYNASVQQQSGEDWAGVAMTLSTASPSLVASSPSLEPLPIRLGAIPSAGKPSSSSVDYEEARRQLAQQQKSLSLGRRYAANEPASGVVQEGVATDGAFDELFGSGFGRRGGIGGGGGGFGAAYGAGEFSRLVRSSDVRLNRLSNQIQILDLTCEAIDSRTRPAGGNGEGISVEYQLANRTTLPSRSDQQLIRIAALPLDGEFYRVARPVLTEYVYEEARVVNDTDFVLLAGPAATFLGDRFVGRGAAPTVAVGEPFTIGLGIDESLRASRGLVKKDRRVQGGNRIDRFDYRLTIENFGDTPAEVRLYDRLPMADDAEIKVSLVESSPEPTDPEGGADADERKRGLLRWTVVTPAKDQSAGRANVDYAMQLEYDRNRTIVDATGR